MEPRTFAILALLLLLAGTAVYAETEGSFIAVIVNDIDESAEWYESTFDLWPGERLSESGRYEIVNLRKPGLFVELLQLTVADERPDYVKGLFKAGILTSDLKEFAALYEPDFANFSFATGEAREIAGLSRALNTYYQESQPGIFDHNIVVSMIDKNGILRDDFFGTGWGIDEMVSAITGLVKKPKK